MDGARLANAAASLGTSLAAITQDVGIDILSFGGTKNGLMLGEAVVFLNPRFAEDFSFIRKQGMQLISKMRFIAAQFIALLKDDLWLKNAQHANAMAKLLEKKLKTLPKIRLTQEVQANAVFAILDSPLISLLQQKYPFYEWNPSTHEVRWMTSWDTTQEDIEAFIDYLQTLL